MIVEPCNPSIVLGGAQRCGSFAELTSTYMILHMLHKEPGDATSR